MGKGEGCFLQTLNAGCMVIVLFVAGLAVMGAVLSCSGR